MTPELTELGTKIECSYRELVAIDQLKPYPENENKHSEEQVQLLARLIKAHGWRHPIIVSKLSGYITAGHGRYYAALQNGETNVPVDYQNFESKALEDAFRASDNLIALKAEIDEYKLSLTLRSLPVDFDKELLGLYPSELPDLLALTDSESGGEGGDGAASQQSGRLKELFGYAPFSVFNAREGDWQDRKREWIDLGIKSEEGRGENMLGMSFTAALKKGNVKDTPEARAEWNARAREAQARKRKANEQ